jgi:hypothetical protein
MCGELFPVPNYGAKPIIVVTKLSEEDETMEKSPSGKKGICCNCGREKWIAGKGLCATCLNAVKGWLDGSPEYIKALADAKKRLTDQDHKSGRGGNHRTKKLSPDKIKEAKTHVRALSIKQSGGDPDTSYIIAKIDMKIEYHQGMIGKLKQAKEILL